MWLLLLLLICLWSSFSVSSSTWQGAHCYPYITCVLGFSTKQLYAWTSKYLFTFAVRVLFVLFSIAGDEKTLFSRPTDRTGWVCAMHIGFFLLAPLSRHIPSYFQLCKKKKKRSSHIAPPACPSNEGRWATGLSHLLAFYCHCAVWWNWHNTTCLCLSSDLMNARAEKRKRGEAKGKGKDKRKQSDEEKKERRRETERGI